MEEYKELSGGWESSPSSWLASIPAGVCSNMRWPGLRDVLRDKVACQQFTFPPGYKFPYLNVAKVNILIVEVGTVSQPGEGTSRS